SRPASDPARTHGTRHDCPRHARPTPVGPRARSVVDGQGVRPARIPGEARRRGGQPFRNRGARLGRALRPVLERRRRVRAAAATQARSPGKGLRHSHTARRRLSARRRNRLAMQALSLRMRLTLWYTLAIVVILGVFGAGLWWTEGRLGIRRADRELD